MYKLSVSIVDPLSHLHLLPYHLLLPEELQDLDQCSRFWMALQPLM